MFRTVGDQLSLFESALPEQLLRLPEELFRVEAMLDDPAFFAPHVLRPVYRSAVDADRDLSAVDVSEVPLPVGLGVPVPREGGLDQLASFLRIPLDGAVPHPHTLMELTTRCGSAAVGGLNETLLGQGRRGTAIVTGAWSVQVDG